MNTAEAMQSLHSLPASWRSGIASGIIVFLAALAGLYMRAEAVDIDQHLAYTQLLRDLRELDARIDGELLANRLELSRNYDALTRYTAAVLERVRRADDVPAYLSDADRAAVQAAARALKASLEQKASAVDDFKRNDAVLRNSLAFFPTAAASLLDARLDPPLAPPLRHNIDNYVRALLVYARQPSETVGREATSSAHRLDTTPSPAAHRKLIDNLRRHGDVIHQRLGKIDRLMVEISMLPTAFQLEALNREYASSHGHALERAFFFRSLLYALVVLLAVYLARTFLRLDRTRQSLERANREISNRYAAQLAAEKQLKLHATAFLNAQEGIFLTDAAGNILDVNPAFTRITGWERSEVIGRNPRVLKSGRHDRAFYAAMWKSISETGSWRGEIWNRNKHGEIYPEMLSISAVRDETGQLINYVAVFADISRIKAQEQQLTRIAYFDALTELPNRMLLADRLVQGISQTRRSQSTMAVCYLDLDGFKPINDTWGHDVGDKVLVEMAHRLQQAVRGGDTVARLGGDEFVLLLLGLKGIDDCNEAIERLLQQIAQPIPFLSEAATITASIGVTLFPLDDADPDTLLRHADQAMYQAKQAGKNRYHVFDAEQDRTVRSHHDRLVRIRQALENRELVLYYQPKVDMRQGRVIGAEALIRWNHPERGLVPPIEFLPLAENDDLIELIGDWVIESALVQMEAWHAEGIDLAVSVNVASRQLQAPGFVEKLKVALHQHPGVAQRLELEVLETTALEDIVKTSRVIDECRELGVHFSLDDFGTGYSSLTYLKRLPADTIKIDQSFVREILSDHDSLVIVQGVIGLASAFQRRIVAEGVETPEHGRLLLQLECDHAQGYGIARPMPACHVAEWVRQWQPDPVWEPFREYIWHDRDYPMLVAEIQLRSWVAQIVYAVNEAQPLPPKHLHLGDPRRCQFSTWYYGHGLQHYGSLPAYALLAAPYERLHQVATRMNQCWQDGNLQVLRGLIPDLLAARDDTLARLRELQLTVGRKRTANS